MYNVKISSGAVAFCDGNEKGAAPRGSRCLGDMLSMDQAALGAARGEARSPAFEIRFTAWELGGSSSLIFYPSLNFLPLVSGVLVLGGCFSGCCPTDLTQLWNFI